MNRKKRKNSERVLFFYLKEREYKERVENNSFPFKDLATWLVFKALGGSRTITVIK